MAVLVYTGGGSGGSTKYYWLMQSGILAVHMLLQNSVYKKPNNLGVEYTQKTHQKY